MHGYLTRNGIPPADFLEIARREVLDHGVTLHAAQVVALDRTANGFVGRLDSGASIICHRVLLATGVVDRVPPLPGVESLYGRSVHHCPYCDGWEWRDRALAVYGKGASAAGLAQLLKAWSADVVICSDGRAGIDRSHRTELERHGIQVDVRRIERLVGREGMLERVVFTDGDSIARDALFFATGNHQSSDLAAQLGCAIDAKGALRCDRHQRTSVPGVYVAGDSDRGPQFVIMAAAEGARAAVTIHEDLMKAAPAAGAHTERSRVQSDGSG